MFARIRDEVGKHVPVAPLVNIIDGYRCIWDYASSDLGLNQIVDYASFDCYYNSNRNGYAISEFALTVAVTTYLRILFVDGSRLVRCYFYQPDLHDRHLAAMLESDFVGPAVNDLAPTTTAVHNAATVKKHKSPDFPSRDPPGDFRRHFCSVPRGDCHNCGRFEGLVLSNVQSRGHEEGRTHTKCTGCFLTMVFD